MLIGVIGNGFVGKATTELKCKEIDLLCYDINPELSDPKGTELKDMLKCDVIFVSVPTPMDKNGSCYTKIVESVVNDLEKVEYKGFVVLRSTLPPGTSKRLNCYFMPEFLTEKNFLNDFRENKEWIFGLKGTNEDREFMKCAQEIFSLAKKHNKIKHDKVTFVSNSEAETIKMFRNCFLATKVAFCNEFYQYCKLKGISYENVRKIATNDERIMPGHSKVPGPDGKLGFGGTCFPKDMSSMWYEMNSTGMEPYLIKSAIERNYKVDRPEKDWSNDKGRAVV